MRIATVSAALLVGAASAAVRDGSQRVLSGSDRPAVDPQQQPPKPKPASENPLASLESFLKGMTSEAKAVWDEMKLFVPDAEAAFEQATASLRPQPHTRRPDSAWDHIVRGADLQAMWVEGADGRKEREIDGVLEHHNLRVKAVDPSKLGLDNVKQYSGYLDDEANDKHLFYWFFESRNDPKNDPVILWLNGGPGCSSLTGLLFELGPASINKQLETVRNEYSWSANASVIFLDQPVNAGYSYSGSKVSSTLAASKDIYALLTLFFHQFPQYAKQDFHIAGESYAGHYIPAFASEILSHPKRNINLKSVLIGNGLTDGLTQYAYYRPMACGEGGWDPVLDESECQSMDNALGRCQSMIQNCYDSGSVWSCVPASIYCNNALIGPYQRTGRNVYDIRGPCKDGNLCYPQLGWIQSYLNRKEVMEALGAEVDTYESCNMNVNRDFLLNGDWMQPFHRLVPKILDQIPVLIYAGTADYICNWLGNQAWTEALEWKGKKDFNRAEVKPLTLASAGGIPEPYGRVKASGNFSFMSIFEAGHMVPYDQPMASLDFVNRWIAGEWYAPPA